MQLIVIPRILGLLLMVFSFTLLPPAVVGWLMGDAELAPFGWAMLVTFSQAYAFGGLSDG